MGRPLCGLMTTDLPRRNSGPAVLGDTWRLLAEEGQAAQVPVVFFHPHVVNVERRLVHGWVWQPDGGWKYDTHPLPPVIVDNVMIHVARTDTLYAGNKRAMHRLGHLLLNPRLPDKWGVWQALCNCEPLRSHLPETALLQEPGELERWLEEHGRLFLKPVRGSGGHGILEISRVEDGLFSVMHETKYEMTRGGLQELERHLLAAEKEKYLLQRALPLLEVDGCKIDVRIVLHRDGARRWQPIATVPRLGSQGQVVTNLARGGQVRSLAWLADLRAEQGFHLPERAEMERVAVWGAEAVTEVRPYLAFLGIDIALDQAGGIWLLDVNPRPGRKVLTMEDRKRAFACLLGYVKSLL